MKSGVNQKVRMGASIFAALTMGTVSVVIPNASTQVQAQQAPTQAVQLQGQGRAARCTVYRGRVYYSSYYGKGYVSGNSGSCSSIQLAIRCGNLSWRYSPFFRGTATLSCPSGYAARVGAIRTPYSSWSYF
jgi:hypothetical protein